MLVTRRSAQGEFIIKGGYSMQIKKTFSDKLSAYVGIKNVFNYTQESPLIDWQNPFSKEFDTSYAYGPLQSRRFLIGFSLKL